MAGKAVQVLPGLRQASRALTPRVDKPIWQQRAGSTRGFWREKVASRTTRPLALPHLTPGYQPPRG